MLHAGREKAHLVQQTGIYKLTDIYENRYNEKKKESIDKSKHTTQV